MTTRQRKIRIGVFAIATGTLVAIVLGTFAGISMFSHRSHYAIVFDDGVMGLESGARVYFNGIKVGTVADVAVAPEDLRHVRAAIVIDRDTPVRIDTTAQLTMTGITGLKVIDLRGGSATSPRLAEGGTISTAPTLIDKLGKQAEKLADQTTELMKNATTLVANASAVADNLAETSRALRAMVDENRVALHDTLASVGQTSTAIARAANATTKLLDDRVGKLVDGASTMLGDASTVIGDIGRVVHTNETQLQSALADIRQASRNFKDLSREIRDKPSRLLFSNAAAERKLP